MHVRTQNYKYDLYALINYIYPNVITEFPVTVIRLRHKFSLNAEVLFHAITLTLASVLIFAIHFFTQNKNMITINHYF